ncbi:hypothetical protein RUND412_001944 [Rhizina undulata]
MSISVAIYRPKFGGNVCHWALFLEGQRHSYLVEAAGPCNEFELNVSENEKPSDSTRHKRDILVQDGYSDKDLESAVDTLRAVPIRNDITEWCCQDYVMEGLEALNGEGTIGDYEYLDARNELDVIFND